jgi:hypothetical protein
MMVLMIVRAEPVGVSSTVDWKAQLYFMMVISYDLPFDVLPWGVNMANPKIFDLHQTLLYLIRLLERGDGRIGSPFSVSNISGLSPVAKTVGAALLHFDSAVTSVSEALRVVQLGVSEAILSEKRLRQGLEVGDETLGLEGSSVSCEILAPFEAL